MRKALISVIAGVLILSSGLIAQTKKELSLSDAVLQQFADLGPTKMRGLDWINESAYIYKKGKNEEESLVGFDLKKNEEKTLLTLSDLNKKLEAFGKTVKSLPAFNSLNNNMLTFSIEGIYFVYLTDKGSLKSFHNEVDGISDVHINSSGNAMAYVKDNNVFYTDFNHEILQVSQDGSHNIVYGKAVSRFEFGINDGIFWKPDGSSFAYYRNDQSSVTDYPLVDLNSVPAVHKPIKYPMAGGPSEKVSLEYFTRDGTQVAFKTDPNIDSYICSVNWTPDASQVILVVLNREQNIARYLRFDGGSGEFMGIELEEHDEKYVEPLFPLIFTKSDGSEYIFMSQKDGFMHAYLKSGDNESQLTKGNWVITKYLGINNNNTIAYFEGTTEDATENHIYKVDLVKKTFDKISKNKGTYHAKLSPGGDYLITWFSSIDTPGKVVIADKDGIVIKTLHTSSDPLEEYKVQRPELLSIRNSEGILLNARMIKPSDFDDKKKYPVLVYVYNGPHVQLVKNSWWGGASLWMNYLAEMGYIVFTVDGRGSYNRGKDFEQSVFRNLSELEMKDQIDGVNYLKSLSYVDPDKIAVHGWSYGGYMTTSLMLHYPDVFKVGVAGGPVTSWKYYEVMYTERYMDTPSENPEGYKKSDVSNYVNNLKGKLLLIHGMNDNTVVPQHNLALVKNFIDEGVQVDFFPYPGHEHNVRGKDRVHLMQKVIDYIDEKLK